MPEAKKHANARSRRLMKFIKSPRHAYPLTFLLAYGVLFCLYDLRQVPKQRAELLDQSFRRLALASDQIRSAIENIARVLESEADRINRDHSHSANDRKGEHALRADHNTPVVRDFVFSTGCGNKPDGEEGFRFQVLAGVKPTIFVSLKRGNAVVCGESRLQATIESATRDLVGTGFDDVAVITATGRVMYQNQSSALRIATLGDVAAALVTGNRAPTEDKGRAGTRKKPYRYLRE